MTKVAVTLIHGKIQKADEGRSWLVAMRMWAYKMCSNVDPRLTLIYVTSTSLWDETKLCPRLQITFVVGGTLNTTAT